MMRMKMQHLAWVIKPIREVSIFVVTDRVNLDIIFLFPLRPLQRKLILLSAFLVEVSEEGFVGAFLESLNIAPEYLFDFGQWRHLASAVFVGLRRALLSVHILNVGRKFNCLREQR